MGGGGSAAQPQVRDPDRPRYHVQPAQGWMNDPNGPVFYKGHYHMFYQHLPNACEWAFGIVWGHAVSSDLVHWTHLPPALVPTPGTLDADGCFSGSCVLDSDGTPVLLYTGVRLRSNLEAGPLPPAEHDLGMVWVETQLAAVPEDPDDDLLIRWRKIESPFLHLPPSHLQLTGWRDPFVFTTNTAAAPTESAGFEANGYSRDIRMLIGSGLKGKGGTALVYKSRSLLEGWELEGTLCEATNTDTGVVWECPLLVPLDPVPRPLRAPSRRSPPRWLLPGGAAAAAAAAAAAEAATQLQVAIAHQRTSSFAFDQDPSLVSMDLAEAAASAVHAWQQAAGGSAAASPDKGASLAPADAAKAVRKALRLRGGGALPGAAQEPPAAAAASADPEAPSNAGALPPGRRRPPVAGAKLALESAATLEHWSAANSGGQSPAGQCSPGRLVSPPSGAQQQQQQQQQHAGLQPPAAADGPAGDSAARSDGGSSGGSGSGDGSDGEDRFAAAFSRVRSIRARKRSKDQSSAALAAAAAPPAAADGGAALAAVAPDDAASPEPPGRQWHFFTVSPDAPTNPVLYWMGHVQDTAEARFELETAKGPYRLDLGDILYAPNVCQDDKGRWLLWGWLQERRKMGSYNYAGCLTLPRVLHCTEDGRLVQAPIPELEALRQGPAWHQHSVRVPAEEAVPLRAPAAAFALDIELTIDRASSYAAGILFRSYEAEADGGTALVYDWERNALEAIFNVPASWQPQAACAASSAAGEEEHFDPALLLTPRPSTANLAAAGLSRNTSAIFSPEGFASSSVSPSATPRTATASLADELSSSVLSPARSGITIAGVPRMPALDLGIPGLPPPPHAADEAASAFGTSAGSARSVPFGPPGGPGSLSRSLSAFQAGFGGGGGGPGGLAVGSLPTGGGLTRSVSDVRGGLVPRVRSYTALSQLGGGLPRMGSTMGLSLLSPRLSPQPPQPLGQDTDADLDFLLDELAAPMREAPPPVVEPRRVGGPLPLMHPSDPLHLRVLVDHSAVEVFTGTGEVLSTRIYRGQAPEGCLDAGISFIAFGGAAVVQRCTVHEMGSAWEQAKASAAASAAASPQHAAAAPPSRGASAAASPSAAAATAAKAAGLPLHAVAVEADSEAAAAAAAAADALLDDLVTLAVSPQCTTQQMVGAFS